MSWFSKKLKKFTNVVDPVGKYLRKSTGGSYGDPMNWYQSKPNTTQPWQPRQSPGLMPAPGGPPPQGQSFGQNTGGYNYVQNQFAGKPPAPNTPPPMTGGGAMSFGGGAPQVGMAPPPSMQGPRDAMAQITNPQMQNQMMRIGAIRGSVV